MIYLKSLKQSKGQALVEAALITPSYYCFPFCDCMVCSHYAYMAANFYGCPLRYGFNCISYTPFSQKYIEEDIKDYLCNPNTVGRTLDRQKLDVKIELSDYEPIKYNVNITDFKNIVSILSNFKGLVPVFNKKSFVEVKYSYKIPSVLKITGKGKNAIEIKARSEVLSGAGSQKARDGKNK